MYLTNFARFARPLTDMTCNNMTNTLNWTEEHKRILDAPKQMLCDATILHVAEYGKPYCILVDASKTAVGNCLFQWSDDGRERPVTFASCKLTALLASKLGRQYWSWGIIYAVIWSLRKYRNLIFVGSKITYYCYHNPLLYITEGVTSSAKLLRWSLALQQFDVSFKYRPGRQNIVADCLSRLCD